MHLLITGGAGYLGTVTTRLLLAQGYQVTIFDRFTYGTAPLSAIIHPHLRVIRGDVRQLPDLAQVGPVDRVIHLAGIVGYPACAKDPLAAVTINETGTLMVCDTFGAGKVILASTTSVYGPQTSAVDESAGCRPASVYGQTKLNAERLVLPEGVVLRFATLYGPSPRMRWDQLPHDFARTAVREGQLRVYQPGALRAFLHVEDAATALRWACTEAQPGTVWNVSDGTDHTKTAVACYVSQATGCTVEGVPGEDPEQRDYGIRVGRIHSTSWTPAYTLQETLPQIAALVRLEEGR